MKSKQVLSWKPEDWKTKLQFMKPSGDGAIGVLFCWASNEVINNPLFEYRMDQCAFVIKPEKGTPTGVKFAESLLKKIANVGSLHTKPIERNSPIGRAIMDRIFFFKNSVPADQRDRWNQVFPVYHNATHFLIQEFLHGTEEMADVYRSQNGLIRIVTDQQLMINLGKLFVADAVLGNGDRLAILNTGNIRYAPNGKLFAIDSNTVLTNYYEVLNDQSKASWSDSFANLTPSKWAEWTVLENHGATPVPAEAQGKIPAVSVPGFRMKYLNNPDLWWDLQFKGHLLLKLQGVNTPLPTEQQWSQAKIWFKSGVSQGLVAVDQKLSGLNWLLVKNKYKSYVTKYGGVTTNVDWTNFKIRRLYIQSLRKGQSGDQAMQTVRAYVERKFSDAL